MQELGFEIQEMDLRIQWSLLTRIRAEANAYKSAGGVSTDSLTRYLSALESLAEYVATRCRGSALLDEVRAVGKREHVVQPLTKVKQRRPRLIPFTAKAEAQGLVAAGDVGSESLAG